MLYYCNSTKYERSTEFSKLDFKNITDFDVDFVIGVDSEYAYNGDYFLTISNSLLKNLSEPDIDLDMNIIISANIETFDISKMKNSRLYTSITRVFQKEIPFKVINIKNILDNIIEQNFKDKYDLTFYTPKFLKVYRNMNLLLSYVRYIPNSSSNIANEFFNEKINFSQLNSQNIKIIFKKYFNNCLENIQFVNTADFEKYIILHKFFRDVLNVNIQQIPKYKKIMNLMSIISTNITEFDNLMDIFKNDIFTPNVETLLNYFRSIQKLQNLKSFIKIPNKLFNNIRVYKNEIKYDFCGGLFIVKWPESQPNFPKKAIEFVNTIIALGEFNNIKNESEKIILLNC